MVPSRGRAHTHGRIVRGKNVGITYTAECNLRVAGLVDTEELILVGGMGDIQFCHQHGSVSSLRGTVIEYYWYWSNLSFDISRMGQLHGGKGDGTSRNHCVDILRKQLRRTIVAMERSAKRAFIGNVGAE